MYLRQRRVEVSTLRHRSPPDAAHVLSRLTHYKLVRATILLFRVPSSSMLSCMLGDDTDGSNSRHYSRQRPIPDAAALLRGKQVSPQLLVITRRGQAFVIMLSVDAYELGERERPILQLLVRAGSLLPSAFRTRSWKRCASQMRPTLLPTPGGIPTASELPLTHQLPPEPPRTSAEPR